MSRFILLQVLMLLFLQEARAQRSAAIVSGPMIGHTEMRTAKLWVEFGKNIKRANIYVRNDSTAARTLVQQLSLSGGEFNTAQFTLSSLEPGTTYKYYLSVNDGSSFVDSGSVTTQSLWQWRKPAPDFSFLAGSCAYLNEKKYDRPGKPYGGDSSIFGQMAKEKSAFMLWLGDNWYTREPDYQSEWGLHYRPSRERRLPVYKPLFKAMPQYAIWDDHDYGPNDADKSYILKKTSREVFMQYWANPSYGMDNEGIYTEFLWNDANIFLLDDRWWRSDDDLPDSIQGRPNPDKKMFGSSQMEWLKNALKFSSINKNISFRIIATGSQVLNPLSPYDCLRHFPSEFDELLQFLADEKIDDVIFLTGDRHHSEIIKRERPGMYALYDITASPLTSTVAPTSAKEKDSPFRVGKEIDLQNYARISLSGRDKDRTLTVSFIGLKGETISTWSVTSKELSNTK